MGFVIVPIVIVLVIISSCLKIVPQSQAYVIERLGAYVGTWTVGIHFKLPIFDRISKMMGRCFGF